MRFLPREIWDAFPRESQLRQSRTTQPTVHAGCFSISIIHRTPTWTTGSLTCAQTLIQAVAHGGVRTHTRESALKVDSGRKIPCRTRESNLHQPGDGLMLQATSYIPTIKQLNELCCLRLLGGPSSFKSWNLEPVVRMQYDPTQAFHSPMRASARSNVTQYETENPTRKKTAPIANSSKPILPASFRLSRTILLI